MHPTSICLLLPIEFISDDVMNIMIARTDRKEYHDINIKKSWLHMWRMVSLLTYIERKPSLVYTLILIVSHQFSIKLTSFLFLSIVLSIFVRHIRPFKIKYVTSNDL